MDTASLKRIVIVGGGQAGVQAAASLREGGFEGAITLVGEENDPPYQRPPLSKAYMMGKLDRSRLYFKPGAWYDDHGVDAVLSTKACGIDRQRRAVELEFGGRLPYDALILATGARPRPLPVPGADLDGVFDVRGLADIDRIAPRLIAGKRLVIVGAGYIGLEAAAAARQMGLEVTVLEMAPRVLARVTSPVMSEFFTREHARQGVGIRTATRLEALEGSGGAVLAARLAGGETLPADLVICGIGILPNTELAAEAGLGVGSGIRVDRDARTTDPRIFACGDCTERPLVHYGRTGRLESVHNAIEQAKCAAAALLGRKRPQEDVPWFWSDQYDLKLQIAGLSQGFDAHAVRGDPESRRFSVFYFQRGRLAACDAVQSPPDYMVAKKLIAEGRTLPPETLADTSASMKELMALAA